MDLPPAGGLSQLHGRSGARAADVDSPVEKLCGVCAIRHELYTGNWRGRPITGLPVPAFRRKLFDSTRKRRIGSKRIARSARPRPRKGRRFGQAAAAASGCDGLILRVRGPRSGLRPVVVRRRWHSRNRLTPFRPVRRDGLASHPLEDSPFRSVRSAPFGVRAGGSERGRRAGSAASRAPPEKSVGNRSGAHPGTVRAPPDGWSRVIAADSSGACGGWSIAFARAAVPRVGAVDARGRWMPGPVRSSETESKRASPLFRAGAHRLRRRQERSAPERVARVPSPGPAHLTPHSLSCAIRALNCILRFGARTTQDVGCRAQAPVSRARDRFRRGSSSGAGSATGSPARSASRSPGAH